MGRRETSYLKKGKPAVYPAARFLSCIMPAGFTKEQTKKRRRDFNKPKRAQVERRRRAGKRAAADLDCRASAVFAVLHEEWQSSSDVARRVECARAFRSADGRRLSGNSLRRVVARVLNSYELSSKIEKMIVRRRNVEVAMFRLRAR